MMTKAMIELIIKSEIIVIIKSFTKEKNLKCKKREELYNMSVYDLVKYLSKKYKKGVKS
jgi:hypothetical protein